ncbi:MAG: hypothetical protein ABW068_14070, partial [Candidatus Thiodiazotropha sp.]
AYGSSGFQYRLATTGDYQPSLRFPWLAASERFPHEVLPAQRDRYSIAGWYRVINNQQGRIDPPR